MKAKLDTAWKAYQNRWRLVKWFAEKYPDDPRAKESRSNSRIKFEKLARKKLGNNNRVTFEWQEDGGVIVAGVIAFSLT